MGISEDTNDEIQDWITRIRSDPKLLATFYQKYKEALLFWSLIWYELSQREKGKR